MAVQIAFRPLGDTRGFAFDTPNGVTLVFDTELSCPDQLTLAMELLDPDEFDEAYPLLTA